jgi:hypothetical protein
MLSPAQIPWSFSAISALQPQVAPPEAFVLVLIPPLPLAQLIIVVLGPEMALVKKKVKPGVAMILPVWMLG